MENTNEITSSRHVSKTLLTIILVIGFVTTFASGFLLSHLLSSEQNVSTGKTTQKGFIPIPVDTSTYPTANAPQIPQDSTKFLPGKHYFDDTLIIVTKDKPQVSIAATVTRLEQDKNYAQNTRISYFDGSNWSRQSDNKTVSDSTIVSGDLVKTWGVTIDPSRVLKQQAQGELTMNNTSLKFTTGVLQNEISIRSLPGYTKFLSVGSGTLKINGIEHQAYILYTHIYSLNAAEIQFYNQPFGVTTDFILFWDSEGNFYHVDATTVDKPTQIYQTHRLGVLEEVSGAVLKTFDLDIHRGSETPPATYALSLKAPITRTLNLRRLDSINKAPNNSFTWFMGNIEGTVTTDDGRNLSGVGIVEYIRD